MAYSRIWKGNYLKDISEENPYIILNFSQIKQEEDENNRKIAIDFIGKFILVHFEIVC